MVRHARRLVFQLAEVLVLPRKEGNADGDTGTDLQATLGTWLAHFGSTGINDGYVVVQGKLAAPKERLGLGREILGFRR